MIESGPAERIVKSTLGPEVFRVYFEIRDSFKRRNEKSG
jgi:hypothetical protein